MIITAQRSGSSCIYRYEIGYGSRKVKHENTTRELASGKEFLNVTLKSENCYLKSFTHVAALSQQRCVSGRRIERSGKIASDACLSITLLGARGRSHPAGGSRRGYYPEFAVPRAKPATAATAAYLRDATRPQFLHALRGCAGAAAQPPPPPPRLAG